MTGLIVIALLTSIGVLLYQIHEALQIGLDLAREADADRKKTINGIDCHIDETRALLQRLSQIEDEVATIRRHQQ